MADYHGDIMYRTGTIYRGRDDTNYLVVILLLFFLGGLGVHRFYLNHIGIGLAYLLGFFGAAFLSFAMLDFSFLFWETLIAGVFLLMELMFFIYKWSAQ